ncbi:hypothetical protein EW146_g3274 [Bondarzewia mesenterica]|uniref:GH16 domain-containing protein n=1 Tax=Bondarzewia mesenterica TaxID=1095465 RepID=A0A4S4LY19_9AGAM|nr:hypothetical protein EW146_g3274 [Bondarzewia mesenterica]
MHTVSVLLFLSLPLFIVADSPFGRSRFNLRNGTRISKRYSQVDYHGGSTFLDDWDFFTSTDPTKGYVNYVDKNTAVSSGLAYLQSDGAYVLAVDDTTTLPSGARRNSIRISSKKTYNGGLFIADFWAMPTGCGTWPAWWSVRSGSGWPAGGEIDIVEGVNNAHANQMTLHTAGQCYTDTTWVSDERTTGTVLSTNCASSNANDEGCGFRDNRATSFGSGFQDGPGGVFAHLWTSDGITAWFFPRAEIPADITAGHPDPSSWGPPVAAWGSASCNIADNFYDHVLVLNTDICGTWAGNAAVYQNSGCPGTCANAVADPSHFSSEQQWILIYLEIVLTIIADAKWKINYIATVRNLVSYARVFFHKWRLMISTYSRLRCAASAVQKRIGVIGAGANGLAALQVLGDTPQVKAGLWKLTAFEQREKVGGIWLPAPPTDDPPYTPLYDSLYTNLAHPFLAFSSYGFPAGTPLFPTAAIAHKYLQDYATHFDLLGYIQFDTRVEETRWDAEKAVWKVKLSTGETQDFDFLVVANGHYRKPRYPDTPGVKKWIDEGKAFHSAWYRRPSELAHHKKVLVVGGGLSSLDIVAELRTVAKEILQSLVSDTWWGGNPYPPDAEGFRKVGKVAEYKDNGVVVFEDGTTESDVDFVVLATGFEFEFPFFPYVSNTVAKPLSQLPDRLQNSTYHLYPLAKHLRAPGVLFEDQARAIVRVLEDPSALDVEAEKGGHRGTQWLNFAPHEPFEYRAELNEFAGRKWEPFEGEVESWDRKFELRDAWNDVTRRGEGETWIKGVGENGIQDWVDVCRRLLKSHEEK